MHDYTFQENYEGYRPDRHGRGIVRTVIMWAAIAVLAMLALGVVAWVFGLVFHLAALLIKVALVTAMVALVWRWVTRHHRREDV
jgi:hypothetical protein